MADTSSLRIATPSPTDVAFTREFAATPERLFPLWTERDHLLRWMWGPDEWPLVDCDSDPRPGGALRFLWRNADGKDMIMHGEYREVSALARIVHTERFDDDWTGGETLATTEFVEKDGRTVMMLTVRYTTQAVRDQVVQSGMAAGMEMCYRRLDALLQESF